MFKMFFYILLFMFSLQSHAAGFLNDKDAKKLQQNLRESWVREYASAMVPFKTYSKSSLKVSMIDSELENSGLVQVSTPSQEQTRRFLVRSSVEIDEVPQDIESFLRILRHYLHFEGLKINKASVAEEKLEKLFAIINLGNAKVNCKQGKVFQCILQLRQMDYSLSLTRDGNLSLNSK